ncbi:MAG: methicillin resistance protein [uncultured bacterium]|nr:MAG: methicillin resistance protein [uncultured bacterium]
MTENINFKWDENVSPQNWDNLLSQLNGHPLQSAKWGDSKKASCGVKDHRWAVFKNELPVFLVRFEEKRIFKFLKIAWAPKGPVVVDKNDEVVLRKAFLSKLKKRGFIFCATNPWEKIEFKKILNSVFYTIWIDLTLQKEELWKNLHKQCRYDIRRAKKLGVIVEKTDSVDDFNAFYAACVSISETKGFNLGNAGQLMAYLFSEKNPGQVESCLFVARHEGHICGGAFLMRSGENIHYLWGAVNRKFSHLCIGEALQWGVIEWALSMNCKKYDLEGISTTNSGNDKFKKRFSGKIVMCPGVKTYPLQMGSSIMLFLMNFYLWSRPGIIFIKNNFLFIPLRGIKNIVFRFFTKGFSK